MVNRENAPNNKTSSKGTVSAADIAPSSAQRATARSAASSAAKKPHQRPVASQGFGGVISASVLVLIVALAGAVAHLVRAKSV